MNTKKRSSLPFIAALFFATILFMGCNDDEPTVGTVVLKMDASSATGNTINGRVSANSIITDIKLNTREVEFEFDEEDAQFKMDSTYDSDRDVKLKGPFVLDLLDQNAFVEQMITTVNLPNARYEEVEFKLHKSTDAGAMNGKSIMITGTIDGKPFIFWHDTDEEFEVDFGNATTDIQIRGNTAPMVINLALDGLFSTLKGGVSLSSAEDGDGDGVIEINPGSADNDGNKDLADAIKDLLEHATDLIDDKD